MRYLRARAAFFDRVVVNALGRNVSQVVSVAAGYDGRALRYAKPGVRWFELAAAGEWLAARRPVAHAVRGAGCVSGAPRVVLAARRPAVAGDGGHAAGAEPGHNSRRRRSSCAPAALPRDDRGAGRAHAQRPHLRGRCRAPRRHSVARGRGLRAIAESWIRDGGPAWVARVFPATRPLERTRADAEVLRWLERAEYPAERCARPEPITIHRDQAVLVTERVPGRTAGWDQASFGVLGDRLGMLHALPLACETACPMGGGWHHLVSRGGPDDSSSRRLRSSMKLGIGRTTRSERCTGRCAPSCCNPTPQPPATVADSPSLRPPQRDRGQAG
jgi:Leucine carboxyl methyltransferase